MDKPGGETQPPNEGSRRSSGGSQSFGMEAGEWAGEKKACMGREEC